MTAATATPDAEIEPPTAGHVPDAVAPPPHHPRYPLLDGMRAIAVLCVVGVHVALSASPGSTPLPGLFAHLNLGVAIFFALSGFLLYRPFIAHRTGGGKAPAKLTYLRRRALRILPAYWLALIVLTVLPGTTGVDGGHWLAQFSLTHTLPFGDAASRCTTDLDCGLAQTWSLVVEVSFYAALPLWFVLSERWARGASLRRWAGSELAVLAMLSVISLLLDLKVTNSDVATVIGGTAAGWMLYFAIGMSLAIVSVAVAGRSWPRPLELLRRHPSASWLIAIGIYALLCVRLPQTSFLLETDQRLWTDLAFGAIAGLLIAPAAFGDPTRGLPARVLSNRVISTLGLISYGVFLWHYVVSQELGSRGSGLSFWPLLAATLAISIAAATISYLVVERPLLKLK